MKFQKKYLLTLIPIELLMVYIFREDVIELLINAWGLGKDFGYRIVGA